MTVSKICPTGSIYKLSQELIEIENKLNANLLNEIQRIALITDLENMFGEIETSELETRLTILGDESTENQEKIEFDLVAIKKIKGVWEGIYHNCMRAELSSLTQICNKTEIALTSLQQISPEATNKHYRTLKNIQQTLVLLKDNPHLNADENNIVKKYLSQVEELLSSFRGDLPIEDFSLQDSNIELLRNSEEILLQLFSFLSPQDLARLSKCNKYLYNLCQDDTLWKSILQQECPTLSISEGKSAKEIYITENSIINRLKALKDEYRVYSILEKLDRQENRPTSSIHKNGNLVFWGFCDGTIDVWDVNDFSRIRCATFKGHQCSVTSLLKEKDFLISGSEQHEIKIWDISADLATSRCIATLTGDQDGVCSSLHKNGNRLFSGSHDGAINVWDLSDLTNTRCIATLKHLKGVRCFQSDGNFLFSGSHDGAINVWDLTDLNNIQCTALNKQRHPIICLLKEGDFLFSSSAENIKVWDLSDLTNIRCIAALELLHCATHLYKDGNLLFSYSIWGNSMKVWDLITHRCIRTFEGVDPENLGR